MDGACLGDQAAFLKGIAEVIFWFSESMSQGGGGPAETSSPQIGGLWGCLLAPMLKFMMAEILFVESERINGWRYPETC